MFGCTSEDNTINSHVNIENKINAELIDLRRRYTRVSDTLAETECKLCEERKKFERKLNECLVNEEAKYMELKGQHAIDLSQLRDLKQREIEQLKNKLKVLLEDVDKENKQFRLLATKNMSLESELKNLQEKYTTDLTEMHNQHKEEIIRITKEVNEENEEQRSSLFRKIFLLETENKKLQHILNTNESSEEIKERNDSLQIELIKKEEIIKNLEEKMHNYELLIHTKDIDMEELRRHHQTLEVSIQSSRAAIQQLAQELSSKALELTTLQNEKEIQSATVQKLLQAKHSVEEDVVAVQAENQQLTKTVEKMRQANDELMRMLGKIYERPSNASSSNDGLILR